VRATHGQSLVEFAVILPMLILIVLGTLELGWTIYSAVVVANAAYVGATYAGLHPNQFPGNCADPMPVSSTLRTAVISQMVTLGTTDGNPIVRCVSGTDPFTYTVSVSPTTVITNFRAVTITVEYGQGIIGPYPVPFAVLTSTRSVQTRIPPWCNGAC
jgi:Flp pilus assembly protein TadG